MTEREEILVLRAENAELVKTIGVLTEKVHFLLSLVEKQGVKKDSHNSSLAPSSDMSRPLKSLRVKSVRPIGGQKGHTGHTLEQSQHPDIIHDLKSNYCQNCGSSLEGRFQELLSRRQVVDIPPIVPIFEEFRQYGCTCGHCGLVQKGAYPSDVTAPIQYGGRIIALVSYLSVYQYVPFKRLSHLFSAFFNLPLSQGTLNNLLIKAAEKAAPVYEQIRQNISQSTVVGSDETSAKVNGKKWWIWVWQNIQNTFIVASSNRGFDTIETHFQDGFQQATLISDRWAAQLKAIAKNHQLCLAHLLRETIFLKETEKNAFAIDFLELLNQALKYRKQLENNQKAATKEQKEASQLEQQLNLLLAQNIEKESYPQTATLQVSIIKNRNYLFPFLYNLDIPPDNNGSERAIRNVKVKQKISGQFKSGQDAFCVLRSLIDTFIKRKLDVFQTLLQVITVVPE